MVLRGCGAASGSRAKESLGYFRKANGGLFNPDVLGMFWGGPDTELGRFETEALSASTPGPHPHFVTSPKP